MNVHSYQKSNGTALFYTPSQTSIDWRFGHWLTVVLHNYAFPFCACCGVCSQQAYQTLVACWLKIVTDENKSFGRKLTMFEVWGVKLHTPTVRYQYGLQTELNVQKFLSKPINCSHA